MNALFNLGEMAVSWMFPQVGATLQGYRWAKTAYNVCKAGADYASGGTGTIGKLAARSIFDGSGQTCEAIRDRCIDLNPTDKYHVGGCYVAYATCKVFGVFFG